ncbi:uncharacterized protein LOC113296520 [Papaver somniferum]|uniref:uncharacterized protein LOC113296520 n=1 Tax=Papaver somniferum TaxID=3469 RepID=UPI000E6FE2AF|nr:uncharacterized protein LOC113296520 [Papaver somniferum]
MAENTSSSANGNHNEPPPDSDAMEKIRKKEQEEREEFERLRVENDVEFQLWMRKLDAKKARRHKQKLQRRGGWKCSWGKTRSVTESDSEDEENNCEGVEDEENSDDSIKRDEREKQAERKKRKRQEFEDVMYKCYLTEKKKNPRKCARTMSKPLNVDSDGEEIPGLDLDGEPVFSGSQMVVCNEAEDEEEETEDDDLQGPYTLRQ